VKKQTREQSLVKSNKAPEEVGFYASLIFLFAHRKFLILQCDILLVFYFHWDDQIYVAHDMLGSLLQSLHDFYFYVVDTWALPTAYSYMYLVDKLHHIAVELLSRFISYLLKLSCTCMARDMLWYYWWNCVRGVPPRTRVILLMKLCEGSPPKITYGTNWWWPQCGTRYMHASCRIHKLFMPLHATWCFPKFPAICPPVVKCF